MLMLSEVIKSVVLSVINLNVVMLNVMVFYLQLKNATLSIMKLIAYAECGNKICCAECH